MKLLTELKRRKVFRVGAAYAVAAWALSQIADLVLANTSAPAWVMQVILLLLALGFPLALILAWAFEVTPDGVKRTELAGDAPGKNSLSTGDAVLIVLMLAVIGIAGYQLAMMPGKAMTEAGERVTEPGRNEDRNAATATPTNGSKSIAVLAFENMSTDAANEYFADGISEEILNLLAGVQDLSVASRTSAFGFKGKDTPVPEIAAALGVRYVLEGSVRKAGDQVRVTAQLIDAQSDRHLWSKTFNRTLDDIFAIQDEIAAAIGDALRVELLGDAGQAVQAEEIDSEIYARFLEARHKLRQRTPEGMREANEMLIEIVEAEPGFARAHVVLGEAYLLNLNRAYPTGVPLVPGSVAVSQARLHAEMARRLNPNLGGIDLILGSIAENIEKDWVAALDHYARAMELEPNEPRPYHWRGMNYCQAGFLARGLADLSQALKLDPENPNVRLAAAGCLISGDNPKQARILSRQAVDLGNPGGTNLIAVSELALGNRQAAIEVIEHMIRAGIGSAENHRESLQHLARDTSAGPASMQSEPSAIHPVNRILLLAVGRYDDYLESLAEADDIPTENAGLWSNRHVEMRRDPRFIAHMERFGVVDLWKALGPPTDCRTEGETFTCGHGHEPLEFAP